MMTLGFLDRIRPRADVAHPATFAGPAQVRAYWEGLRQGAALPTRAALDPRGNVLANDRDYRTSAAKIFAAGDMRRGQSLVVWAIREGRQCARAVDEALMGRTLLPR